MKILLTGGGSGGHFYPIVAVAQSIRKIAKEQKLADVELYYMAPQPYDRQVLYDLGITYVKESAGKSRRYFSVLNIIDLFRTAIGVIKALWSVFMIYPDVVFGKGGYVSFPPLFAAKFYRIPVVIHESDSVPGRLNQWAGKFARKVAVSYSQAAEFFPKEKVAHTGNPIRQELIGLSRDGAHALLKLDPSVPTVLILGGSQGALILNDNILDALPQLLEKYNVIHQTGKNNIVSVQDMSRVVLDKSAHKERYKAVDTLDTPTMRAAAGIADLIVSRAGSTIFEIAVWGIPSILIPITDTNGDHQRKNAYSYARTGAAIIVEEANLTAHILFAEIERLMTNKEELEKMKLATKSFARTDAADVIARELIAIGLEHEK